MPLEDFDKKNVIPMFKEGHLPKYAHNAKEWKNLNADGYSDQPLRTIARYPKTMRMLGEKSITASDPAHEEQLRAQGYHTNPLPKGHNDPNRPIFDAGKPAVSPSRIAELEEINKALVAGMNDLKEQMRLLMTQTSRKHGKDKD